uniref:Spaetzle domain-containing protein n=1 Tax=Trichogramma kaykai TaxID=54128 RepID=A0ABD2W0I6_9HYME
MRRLAVTGLLSLVLLVVVQRRAVGAIEIKHDYKFKNKISALLQRVDSSASGSGSSGSVISGNSYSSTTPSTTTTTTATTSPTTSRQDASLVNVTSVSPVTSAAAAAAATAAAALISGNSTEDAEKPEELPEVCVCAGAEVHEAGTKVPNTKTRDLAADEARHGKSTESLSSEAIMRSIRNNKDMVSALLTDFKIKDYNNNLLREDDEVFLPTTRPGLLGSSSSSYKTSYDHHHQSRYHRDKPNLSLSPYDNRFESNEIKRKYEPYDEPLDNVEEGFTCPSQVKYAKPQLARAASGVWKYIINTDEHTQTLRLEKCS